MSLLIVRQQLEQALDAITPKIDTAWENVFYVPTKGVPFQRVQLFYGEPENPTMDGFYRDVGFLQSTLYYPLQSGPGDAITRAQLLRTTFYRGRSFVSGKITTVIKGTAQRLPSIVEDDRFLVPVRVPFFANVLP
ncbi:phage tail terminator-like protein [Phenylobacterium conjunctum]|uniref:Phage tail terminator-like protein n=1 Tax=Phenylobacterium conjunctum TaxID=1298959 RepID=A0ABW3SZ52_9CAUL